MSHEFENRQVDVKKQWGWILRPLEFALKYSLLGLFLLILLIGAKSFGFRISEASVFGNSLKFEKDVAISLDESNSKIATLEETVSHLTDQIAELVEDAAMRRVTTLTADDVREIPSEQGAVAQPVLEPDPVAGSGYIWLGTYDTQTERWVDGTLVNLASLPIPSGMSGNAYVLSMDVNVRKTFPAPPDKGYYVNVPALGVAKHGEKVTVLGQPKPYLRKSGTQYWAQVQTTYVPKAR